MRRDEGQRAWAVAGVLLACLIAYGAGSARTGFTGRDEMRYAQVAKEMDSVRNCFFPHQQGQVYPDKPPLFFWMVRACYAVAGGVSPWGLRAPVILCTLLTVLLTVDIGRRLFGDRWVGIWGALFYGLSLRVIWSARIARLDPPLVLFVTWAVWFWVRELPARRAGRRPSLAGVLGFWGAMALGFLIKGPLALALGLGITVACDVAQRRWQGLVGRTTWLGVAFFAAVVLGLWVLPGLHFGGWEGYFKRVFTEEGVDQTVRPWQHVKSGVVGILYYFARFWPEFLPGSVLLPGALVLAWRRRRAQDPDRDGVTITAIWVCLVLVAFTFSPSKRPQYILPCYPAAGLLVGWFVRRLLDGRHAMERWVRRPLLGVAVVAVVLGVGVLVPWHIEHEPREYTLGWDVRAALFVALAGLGAWAFVAARRRHWVGALSAVLAVGPAAFAIAFVLHFPRVFPSEPYREVARQLDKLVGPDEPVYMLHKQSLDLNIFGHYFLFRMDREYGLKSLGVPTEGLGVAQTDEGEDSAKSGDGFTNEQWSEFSAKIERLGVQAFDAGKRPMYLLLTPDDYRHLTKAYPDPARQVVERFRLPDESGEHEILLVANHGRLVSKTNR